MKNSSFRAVTEYDALSYDYEVDLDQSDAEFAQRSKEKFYLAILTERSHANRLAEQLGDREEILNHEPDIDPDGFLLDTDFGSSILVVYDIEINSVSKILMAHLPSPSVPR